jgi:hypothetical protein
MHVEIPYVGHTADSMKNKFTYLLNKLRSYLDVRFIVKPSPSVGWFFQNKDHIAEHMRSNSVYLIHCSEYGQMYVDETGHTA